MKKTYKTPTVIACELSAESLLTTSAFDMDNAGIKNGGTLDARRRGRKHVADDYDYEDDFEEDFEE